MAEQAADNAGDDGGAADDTQPLQPTVANTPSRGGEGDRLDATRDRWRRCRWRPSGAALLALALLGIVALMAAQPWLNAAATSTANPRTTVALSYLPVTIDLQPDGLRHEALPLPCAGAAAGDDTPDTADCLLSIADAKRRLSTATGIPARYLVLYRHGGAPAIDGRLRVTARSASTRVDGLAALQQAVAAATATAAAPGGAIADGLRACNALLQGEAAGTGISSNAAASTADACAAAVNAAEASHASIAPALSPGDSLRVVVRPLKGDHIHAAFAVYVGGHLLAPLADSPVEGFPSEGRHVHQLFPHWGMHAGGAGWFDDG